MHLPAKAIAEITHARIHTQEAKLYFSTDKVALPDFIAENKNLMNKIAKALKEEYGLSFNGEFRSAMEQGVKAYLLVEGVLNDRREQ